MIKNCVTLIWPLNLIEYLISDRSLYQVNSVFGLESRINYYKVEELELHMSRLELIKNLFYLFLSLDRIVLGWVFVYLIFKDRYLLISHRT